MITVHPNPYVQNTLRKHLKNIKNIFLIKPLFYPEFIYLLKKCSFVMSDSWWNTGRATYFKKYLILLREKRNEKKQSNLVTLFVDHLEKILKN